MCIRDSGGYYVNYAASRYAVPVTNNDLKKYPEEMCIRDRDVASTLLDSGWESVLIADKNLLIANTDVARNDYVNAHPKSKFTIYRRQIDKHGIPRKVTEVWG